MASKLEMDRPHDPKAFGGGVRRGRRARGGKAGVHVYNAEGSPTMDEVHEGESGFGRGGRKKRQFGGIAGGGAEMGRADKMPRGRRARGGRPQEDEDDDGMNRGGRVRRREGGSVYSEGSAIHQPKETKDSRGHEGVNVPDEPGPG
jgi:hypothetical protein